MHDRLLAAANLRELARAWEAGEDKPTQSAYPLAFLDPRSLTGQAYQTWYEKLAPGFKAYGPNTPGEHPEIPYSWADLCYFSPSEHVVFWNLLAAAIEAGAFE